MEKLLVLTHVDESGAALRKASLESVAAGVELAGALGAIADHRHRGGADGSGGEIDCRRGCARAHGERRGVCASALRQRCCGLRSTLPRGGGDTGARARKFALCSRDARRGLSARRVRGYAHHSVWRKAKTWKLRAGSIVSGWKRTAARNASVVSAAGNRNTCSPAALQTESVQAETVAVTCRNCAPP